ncbi:annexin D5-like [Oryza brachyantha]|uniref:Annexin n=1 Tax=Oryza brachyantha TaxID=4533 RepID=J3MX72_ORYBR|nr:annexin D5-like [Oryza brachyantha]
MASLTLPPALTNPRQDAIDLHKAFKGMGCDSTTVINILTHRDSMQRAIIQQEYRTMYSEDLSRRISSELSGHHKKAMLLWILDPAGRDATVLRDALSGDTIDLRAATEIICSRTPSQLQIMKQTYHAKFGTYLEHDIGQRTSGDHQKLLLAYVGIPRYEGPEVDPTIVTHDAKDLYKAGEKRLGTDEKTFIRIFAERSWAHLASVASAYHHMYDRSLEKVVKSETSGNFEVALLTILRCAENPAKYFAKVLRKSMKGMGTDDSTLIRVVVTRTEIDMQYIKAEYYKKYKKSLAEAIHSETSGNYRTFLLSLVGSH